MTNTEKLITHIKTRLAHESYTVLDWELTMLGKMLKELPCYDEDKVYDIICGEDEARVFDNAEMYRKFISDKFCVGDEVYDDKGYKGIVTRAEKGFYVVMDDGSVGEWDEYSDGWKRTGRNFPAIENILNILKKSEVNNA